MPILALTGSAIGMGCAMALFDSARLRAFAALFCSPACFSVWLILSCPGDERCKHEPSHAPR